MEFPHLGKHCSQSSCKQLDFLPMKCDACFNIFCGEHVSYNSHRCSESYKKDNQVPVCPLCNLPIPIQHGGSPDIVVGRHIDTDCQSDPAKERRKVYTNRCTYKGCKKKELIPVLCDKCRKNFCLRHRHEQDHSCTGFENTGKSITNAGAAALFRFNNSKSSNSHSSNKGRPQQSTLTNIGAQLNRERQNRAQQNIQVSQAGMSEDEALSRAIQLSMAESSNTTSSTSHSGLSQQEQEDLMLAQALYESEQEARNQQMTSANKEKSCVMS